MIRTQYIKVLLPVLLPLILGGCLTLSDRHLDPLEPPAAAAGATSPVSSSQAPELSADPAPWPPYLATYHYSLGVLNNLDENNVEAVKEFEEALKHDPRSSQIATDLASAYAEKGDMQKALAIGEQSVRYNPGDIDLNMILGGLYMNNRDNGRAIAQYRKVIALDPKHISAHLYLGTVYGDDKQYPEALQAFDALLALSPDHLMANYYRGKVLLEMAKYEEAEQAFKKTLIIRPNFDTALLDLALAYERQKKTDAAVESLKDYLALFPDRVKARVKLGELLLREKRYDDAEREFNKVLKGNPDNPEAHLTMGLLYLDSGRYDQAIDMFRELTGKFPEDHRYVYMLASAYEEKKAFGQALQQLDRIPVTSDLYANTQARVAMILKKQGRLPEALAVIEQAMKNKKDPSLPIVLSSLQEEGKDPAGAEKTLQEGLRVFPGNVEMHYALGVLYEKTNRFDDAIRQMEAVLKIDPNHADALNFIGYSYADRGIKLDQAEKMIKKALRLKPGSAYIIDSLGWLYFRQNKIDEALKYLQEASAAMPGDSAIIEHLGDVFLKVGRIKEALEAYQRALKLAPDNKGLQKKVDELQKK